MANYGGRCSAVRVAMRSKLIPNLATVLLLAVTMTVALMLPVATAAPSFDTGGAGVIGGGGGEQTVIVQGSHSEVAGAGAQSVGVSPGGGAGGGGAGGGGGAAPTGPPTRNVPFDGGYWVENAEMGETTGVQVDLSNGPNWCADGGTGVVCRVITDTPLSPDIGMPATPVTLAQVTNIVTSAVTALQIRPIRLSIVPEPVSFPGGRTGLVGMNSWIAPDGDPPAPEEVGPLTRTMTSGAVTVSLNAINTGLLVNYGDGSLPYPCPVQSPRYQDIFGDLPSPTCNHHLGKTSILEPGQVFRPSVTSIWLVSWSAQTPGQTFTGVIPVTPTATTEVRVGELHVLVTPGQ